MVVREAGAGRREMTVAVKMGMDGSGWAMMR